MTEKGRKYFLKILKASQTIPLRMILLYNPFSFSCFLVLTRKLVIGVRAEGCSLFCVGNSQQATRMG